MALALRNTMQAMHLLIETASKEARGQGVDLVQPGSADSKVNGDSAIFQRIGRARHETILELLLCLENLGQMLLIRGSPGEAEVYFRRGLELSKIVNSITFQEKFHLCLAETDYRRLRLPESTKHFSELISSEEVSGDSTKDLAFRHMRRGDLDFRQGDFKEAEVRYERAHRILDHLAAPSFMSAIENMQPL
jgi:tetratricopeptide (TPR) repeat protein